MEQAVNIFEDQVNLFCCVCGAENQKKLMVVPDRCSYERLGGVVCDDCCRACEYYGGCAERLVGPAPPPAKHKHDGVSIPAETMERAFSAWMEFKRNPARMVAFDYFDWLFRIAAAKWDVYALDRRVSQ